jgi:hypothetical protein
MSDEWVIRDTANDNKRTVDSRAEAEEKRHDLIALGAHSDEIEIIPPNATDDAQSESTPEVVEDTEAPEPAPAADALDQLGESLGTDPLSILPGHMIDEIQGQPAVNKRGYCMIAERYGIEVTTDVVAFPWDNDDGRAVAKGTATTDDGKEYTAWATASAEDDDMPDQLIELADTRAAKRSLAWASGVGIVGYQELQGELEGGLE